MRAVIMAGGRGTRLAPYTNVLPKPLMPLGDLPILEVVVGQLARAGIGELTIAVGHMSGLIESWIAHQGDLGVAIDFVYEDEPLGTAGSLRSAPPPGETFLALNGDVLTTLDFAAFAAGHRESGAAATMAVNERTVAIEYGVVHTDGDGRLERLEEKPTLRYEVSMGVYAMEPAIVELIGPGERIDFPDLLMRAVGAGHEVRVHRHEGYWRDIGNRDDYAAAIEDFEADPGRFMASAG